MLTENNTTTRLSRLTILIYTALKNDFNCIGVIKIQLY